MGDKEKILMTKILETTNEKGAKGIDEKINEFIHGIPHERELINVIALNDVENLGIDRVLVTYTSTYSGLQKAVTRTKKIFGGK